ncbi:MAG: cobalt-precorrin-8X methylmutase [Leptolyngbyaceae cyanobacterium SL_7_1]|nr:cobalt-precorrin-8X methylmutase [Leptolyngbyaceae cyanobacterium SL_7_1]
MGLNHPIVEESFAIIDREIGNHRFSPAEYAIVRRVIHSTADFEFQHLLRFSEGAIATAITALRDRTPIITDVGMVKQGIQTMVDKTFHNPTIAAIERQVPTPGKTLSETGMVRCYEEHPNAIYVIGNAPTALLALCDRLPSTSDRPTLIIGAPVGFVSVVEAKAALAPLPVPQIRVEGRKGGSAVAAAIVNALLVLAWEEREGGKSEWDS